LQEDFVELAAAVLHQCIRSQIGAVLLQTINAKTNLHHILAHVYAAQRTKMLIRLPIIILTSLHPTLIADAVPKIDIARECQFKSGSEEDLNRCADDETRINPKLPTKGLSVDPAVFLFWAAGMG
jgi:hypothetical protein